MTQGDSKWDATASRARRADVRWIQRFANYEKALLQLRKFIDKGDLTELEEQGLIKAFEYTYELAWSTLKDYLAYQGEQSITGSRDAIRKSFAAGLISNGDAWMSMLEDRNRTSHTYNEATAGEIAEAIVGTYWAEFLALRSTLQGLSEEEQTIPGNGS